MLCLLFILTGLSMISLSGFMPWLIQGNQKMGQGLTVGLFVIGSISGFTGTVLSFIPTEPSTLIIPWALPWGHFALVIDPFSAFFLFLIFSVPALGSVYSLSYWKQSDHKENGRKLGIFFGLLTGSMAMVVIARDSILFLISWEIMAISAFFAATAEDDRPEVRQSGWVYLIATHMGTLILIAMFALWNKSTGSFSLVASQNIPVKTAGIIFVLSVIGFGFKAGLMPLHVWLPGAHANAPSHVSALMSGVMLKMGIYGIIRMSGLLGQPEYWWGALLIIAGCISGLIGIIFAMSQRDLKKILAYSSIENIGIITMAAGLALIGRSNNRPDLILLGMGGALLHIWNHGLFKSLLFLNSGAIIHGSHTRDIELMGGMAKKMPLTAGLFVVGAVAITALPPLNGFASEWLIYLGFFRTLIPTDIPGLALAGGATVVLAMIGSLAIAAFVKLYGTIFLGTPRSEAAEFAQDPESTMIFPMILLGVTCIAFGLFPMLISPILEKAVYSWIPFTNINLDISSLAPQIRIACFNVSMVLILAVLIFWQKKSRKNRSISRGLTWDCGYSRPTAKMQYTGTSFTESLVRLFSFILQPVTKMQKIESPFPQSAEFEIAVNDTVLNKLIQPIFNFLNRMVPKVYIFQHGQTHFYVLYVLVITIVLFLFSGIGGI